LEGGELTQSEEWPIERGDNLDDDDESHKCQWAELWLCMVVGST
jgi:hypothetical protein